MPFNPNSVTGLVEHWDPDDISGNDGDAISSWAGAVNALSLSGPLGDEPLLMDSTRHSNGKQAALFNSTNHRLEITDASLENAEWTYMMVACVYSVQRSSHWLFNKKNTNAATIALRAENDPGEVGDLSGGVRLDGTEGTFNEATDSSSNRAQTPHVFTMRYDGSELIIRLDGVEVASVSAAGATDTDNSDNLVIGNHPSSFTSLDGWVGDIAIWDNAISDTDMADQEAQLMSDWHISVYNRSWESGSRTDTITPDAGEDEIFSPAIVDDGSQWVMLFAVHEAAGSWRWIDYATAPYNDPHNWTRNAGAPIIDANTDSPPNCRGVAAVHDGADWQILVDGGNGSLYHFSGSLGSLTDNGSVYSGEGTGNLDYARHPCILADQINSKWYVYFDGRDNSATSGVGAIGLTKTSDFSTFEAATEVLSPSNLWWEDTDVGAPTVIKAGEQYLMAYAGYNDSFATGTEAPHFIGAAKSEDAESWTKLTYDVPILAGRQPTSLASADNPELFDDGTDVWLYFVERNDEPDADIVRVKLGDAANTFYKAGSTRHNHLRLRPTIPVLF